MHPDRRLRPRTGYSPPQSVVHAYRTANDKNVQTVLLCRCHICWKDDRTFLIGWADSVKIAVVKDKTPEEAKKYSPTPPPPHPPPPPPPPPPLFSCSATSSLLSRARMYTASDYEADGESRDARRKRNIFLHAREPDDPLQPSQNVKARRTTLTIRCVLVSPLF